MDSVSYITEHSETEKAAEVMTHTGLKAFTATYEVLKAIDVDWYTE